MMTYDLRKQDVSVDDLLRFASDTTIRVISRDGHAFVIESAEDFEQEVVRFGQSGRFRAFLAERAKQKQESVPFEEFERLLATEVPATQCEGETLFACVGRWAAVYPFVAGASLDRGDPLLHEEVARLLAALHHALLSWRSGPRPPAGVDRPALPPDLPELHDSALDVWWLGVGERALLRSVIHGVALELASTTFELCHDD